MESLVLENAITCNDVNTVAKMLCDGAITPCTPLLRQGYTMPNTIPILEMAIRIGAEDVAILLLRAGAPMQFPSAVNWGSTIDAFYLGIAYDRQRFVEVVLKEHRYYVNDSAIKNAALHNKISILQMLLEDFDFKPSYTDLHCALTIYKPNLDIIRLLVKHGAILKYGKFTEYLMYAKHTNIPKSMEDAILGKIQTPMPAEFVSELLDIGISDINDSSGENTILSTLCMYVYPSGLILKALDMGARITKHVLQNAILCSCNYCVDTAASSEENLRLVLDRGGDQALDTALQIVHHEEKHHGAFEHKIRIDLVKRRDALRKRQILGLLHSAPASNAYDTLSPLAQFLYAAPHIAALVGTALFGIKGSLEDQMECLKN